MVAVCYFVGFNFHNMTNKLQILKWNSIVMWKVIQNFWVGNDYDNTIVHDFYEITDKEWSIQIYMVPRECTLKIG